jgi:uncharacterized protein (TIGR02117 family)
MRRLLKGLVVVPVLAAFALALLYAATLRPGDPLLYPARAGEPRFAIFVADHGYHAGLVILREDIGRVGLLSGDPVLLALSDRYAAYQWLEVGWGDETFYRFAPTISQVSVSMAFNALTGQNASTVLHIAGLKLLPEAVFTHSDVQRLELSQRGLENLLGGLASTFAKNGRGLPIELGKGIYGPSLFYRAKGHYSVLSTCNAWLGNLLSAAGLKTSPVASVTSPGLLADLRWRNDLPLDAAAPLGKLD